MSFNFSFAEKVAPVFGHMNTLFSVNQGDDVKIPLDVTGVPLPGISCYYEDRLIISCSGETIRNVDVSLDFSKPVCELGKYVITGLHELIIKFATFAENNGLYKCEANNSVATVAVSFRVNVTRKNFIKRSIYIFHSCIYYTSGKCM